MRRTLSWWRSSLLNKDRDSENRLCGRKLAIQLSLGASWEPELAVGLTQENSRDLEMRYLKVRELLAVESELQNQLNEDL